jgi:hypothetical protein
MEPGDWIIVGVLAALLVLGGLWVVGSAFVAEPEDKNMFLQHAMQGALDEVAIQLPGDEDFVIVAFMPLKGDPKMELTRALARHLRQLDKGRRFRGPDGDYVAAELARDLGEGESLVTDEEKALRVARHVGVQAVLFGEGRMEDTEAHSEIALKLTYVRAPQDRPYRQEKVVRHVSVQQRLTKSVFSLEYYRLRIAGTSVLLRVLFWFLIAAGLPFVCYPLDLKIFSLESNAASLGLLGAFTAVDFTAALFLNGFAFSGVWVLLYLALIVACGVYNLAILNALHEST